ncbi:MAG: HD domain-containing protein [Clostridia bacterium]|nr:HD domain-containing protein [Clostridia bacterium]
MLCVPVYAKQVISRLRERGYEAYLVGGCVRDMLMGRTGGDYDITTSALPEQTCEVFSDKRVIPTGIKHGTVTVMWEDTPVEITTFRIDGSYSDSRHPDSVIFTPSLREDLARRDFTCNALAYCDETGIVDYFGGREDIDNRIIRAVGEPVRRFSEDALRILRGLRFSSILGFDIDKTTCDGMRECVHLLDNVAGERIYTEISKLLCGDNVGAVLREHYDILDSVLCGIGRMHGFLQHSPYHAYDVLEHTIRVVENVPPLPHMRLAALFHDIGKPDTFFIGDDGFGHFYGHAQRSLEIAHNVLARFKCDNATYDAVTMLIKHHDTPIVPSEKSLLRKLRSFGEQRLREMIALQRADMLAQHPDKLYRIEDIDRAEKLLDRLISETRCYDISQLAVGGRDLIAIGYPEGKLLGNALRRMLDMVIDGKCENDRDALLSFAKGYLEKHR